MAFSQVQCLDNNHVNWRASESKPEFFYSEEQRLALEALIAKGPEAFYEVLKKENIRDFLSELELKKILETLETYDPSSEYIPCGQENGDGSSQNEEQGPLPSLEYWPERSDRSIPQLDLGWPETVTYRGVTRATVYMQPPIDFQPHIKEVVRKMIFQAQKVIAVVMDMFTDVDIFKDLIDAGFKRKVAIYIVLDESNLKYFLQMCERAQMHTGHLKHLRVRTMGGSEFFTHSAARFKGTLAQKFMFVDGDKAMTGSYSFTWSAARTDRNVISVLSGQVVEAFDKQFQELYLLSRGVSLKSIPMEEEPEPEPVLLPSVIPVTPANAVVRKMFNPKYALVTVKSTEQTANSDHASSDRNVTEQQRAQAKGKALPEGRVSERPSDLPETAPPIHPGLLNLEKANMFDYLPTWVEPDPEPSEVLGYINIIDPKNKNVQLSQMNRIKVCDVSQANAQHRQMLKQKMQDVQKIQSNQPAPASPSHLHVASSSGHIQEGRNPTEHEQEAPNPMGHEQEAPNCTEHVQEAPNHTGHEQEAPNPSPTERTHGKPPSRDAFATLAIGEHLKQPPHANVHDPTEENGVSSPVPKLRTVHVTDLNSKKSAPVKGEAGHPHTQPLETDGTGTKHKRSPTKAGDAESRRKLARQPSASPKVPDCSLNGVQRGKAEEDEEEVFLSAPGSLSSSSTAPSQHNSDGSSISDECFEGRDRLRRTNSDVLPNGVGPGPHDHLGLQRKLSEPHMSRGTFVSPLGSPQPILSMGLEEAGGLRRRSDSVEEVRCVWGRGRNPHAVPNGYITCPSNAPQGPQFFCYGSRIQLSAGRGKGGIPSTQQAKTPGESKYQQGGARAKKPLPGSQQHWPSKGLGPGKNLQTDHLPHGHVQGTGGFSRTTGGSLSRFQESQRVAEEIRTPFGIPLSKLSQSKHLKTRTGQSSDPKKKSHGTHGHKDQ